MFWLLIDLYQSLHKIQRENTHFTPDINNYIYIIIVSPKEERKVTTFFVPILLIDLQVLRTPLGMSGEEIELCSMMINGELIFLYW